MKVLFVHNRYLQHGGEDTVVDAEIALLQEMGVEVDTFIIQNSRNKIRQVLDVVFSFFNVVSFWRMYRIIRTSNPDVVHVHNWHYRISPSVFWAARLASKPVYFTVHNYRLLCPSGTLVVRGNLFLESIERKFAWPAVFQKVYHESYLVTFFVAFCIYFNSLIRTWDIPTKIVFVNDFMADYMVNSKLRLERSKVYVKPHFVTSVDKQNDILAERRGFVFLGRLSEEKGIDILLEVFSKIAYPITIIGDGPLKSLVVKYASQSKNIRYLGFMQREGIIRELGAAEAMIFPSLCFEGMPVSILESFSCGTPILASYIGSLRSMIQEGKTGMFFSPDDASSMEKTIKEWIGFDETTKVEMRKETLQIFAREYTRERNFDHFRKLYQF